MRLEAPLPFDEPVVFAREAVFGAERDEEPDDDAFVRDEPEDFERDDEPEDFVPEDFERDEDERDDDERDEEDRDEADRELEREDDAAAGLRSLAGTSSLMTSLTRPGICFSRKPCMRSSWRRNSRASLTVSLSPSSLAAASITL